jgi:hypothetical protein
MVHSHNNPVVFPPAIDWLTLATFDWQTYVDSIAWVRAQFPLIWKHARWLQYDGWRNGDGIFYGKAIQTGDREHYVLRVSGGFSQEFLTAWLTTRFADGWYCTRLDLQVTRDIPDWWSPRDLHDEMKALGMFVSLIQSDSGNTIYVGDRGSKRFTRFYEKDLDHLMLRLEFELKGDYSRLGYALLLGGSGVRDIFAANLEKMRFPEHISNDYLPGDYYPVSWYAAKGINDMKRKLQWLRSLIPAFHRMTNDHDIGDQVRDIFYSLSLPPIDKPQQKRDTE